MDMKRKLAVSTVEVAIAVGLSAVVVIMAIGLFTNGLNGVIGKNGMVNMFNKGPEKTAYTSFNRDYAQSQINVQVTGAQGLEMLRRKANNMALELIENPFSTANTKGNEIAYLSKTLEIITGEPHVCAFMKEDSVKHCDEFSKYAYKNQISSALIINKVNGASITLPLSSDIVALLSSYVVPTKDGYPDIETLEVYSLVYKLTQEAKDKLDHSALIVVATSTFENQAVRNLDKDYRSYFEELADMIDENIDTCRCSISDTPNYFSEESKCGKHMNMIDIFAGKRSKSKMYISEAEEDDFYDIIESFTTAQAVVDQLKDGGRLVEIVKQDNYLNPSACVELLTVAGKLRGEGLEIQGFSCVPNTSD